MGQPPLQQNKKEVLDSERKKVSKSVKLNCVCCKEMEHKAYTQLIICPSKFTVFLELRFRKNGRFSEKIVSADKYISSILRKWKILFIYVYSFNTASTDTLNNEYS